MTAAEYLDQLDALHEAGAPEGTWSSERMFWKLQSDLLPDEWWRHITDDNGTVALLAEIDDDIVGSSTAAQRAALIVAAVNALPQLVGALRAVLEADPIEVALGGIDYVQHLVTAALSPAEQAQA